VTTTHPTSTHTQHHFTGSNSVSDFLSVNVRAWPKYTNIYTPPRWVPVHEGFHAAWQTLSAQVLGAVDELAATKMATPDWKVWFTGHSLGAAMTTLAAAQFANSRSADRVGGVYPFSSPRVGSGAFSAGYNAVLGSKTLLVTYGGDAVSMLPYRVTWNYKHVGRQVGLCRSSTNALEVAQVNPINRDSGDGCDNYAAETYFALAAFTRHSPGLIWDALLRTIAGSGGAFSDGAARAACLGAGLATCPGVTGAKKACAAILRCDAWLGTPDQICQSCANGGTCGPSGTLYAGPWQNNALPGCSQSLGIVQGLAPTTCAA
jgi:Lipase (class 3)